MKKYYYLFILAFLACTSCGSSGEKKATEVFNAMEGCFSNSGLSPQQIIDIDSWENVSDEDNAKYKALMECIDKSTEKLKAKEGDFSEKQQDLAKEKFKVLVKSSKYKDVYKKLHLD